MASCMTFLKLIIANTRIVFDEFCKKSVIDGAKYLHSSKPDGVRLFWSLLLFSFTIISSIIIVNFYEQYEKNAIITVVDLIPHDEVYNFPSVFICPGDVWNERRVEQLAVELKRNYQLKMEIGAIIDCIVQFSIEKPLEENLFDVACAEIAQKIEIGEFHGNVSKIFKEIPEFIRNCSFKGVKCDCEQIFTRYFSEAGLCAVFNNVHIYNDYKPKKRYKLIEFEHKWELKFELLVPKTKTKGFLLPTHGTLTLKHHEELLWTKADRPAELKFTIWENTVSKTLRQLSIRQRNCMFRNEPSPYMYTNNAENQNGYSHDICVIHCHAELIFQKCKCLPQRFAKYMKAPASYEPCYFEGYSCVRKLLHKVRLQICKDCYPDCYHIRYSQVKDLVSFKPKNASTRATGPIFENLTISLDYWPLYRYKTTIIYGFFDLLVSIAGVASFFFGFSLIAVLEVIFYCLIRFFSTFYAKRVELKIQVQNDEKLHKPINLSLVPCKRN